MKDHLPWIVPSIIVILGVIGFFIKKLFKKPAKKQQLYAQSLGKKLSFDEINFIYQHERKKYGVE